MQRREAIGRPMEILLVEDCLSHANIAIGALRKGGVRHRMTLVRDGEEAVSFLMRQGKFARAPRPDLVLLDLYLPKKDGLDVLREIRSDYELQDLAVVVLTASDSVEDMQQCRLLGVDRYMTKPVDFAKFVNVVYALRSHLRDDIVLPSLD